MNARECSAALDDWNTQYPDKFAPEEDVFGRIHRGDRIFIGTACGEPQHLVRTLIEYVAVHPQAFFDAEVLHICTLGVAPYNNPKFRRNFRHSTFFIGDNTRDSINRGRADYTPISLSEVAEQFYRGTVPIDVALIQVCPPDSHGHVSLGISLDIVKAAVENSSIVVAQVNMNMPRVHGDTFLHIKDIDFIVPHNEPLLEDVAPPGDDISDRIGQYVARIIKDGDTIQVGYGTIPNAVLASLRDRRHLGVHTELLTDGIVDLMRCGVVDNSHKTIDRGKTVATFCMGSLETYRFLHDNPAVEFRRSEHTNNPLVISRHHNMTAINTALELDLTGQSTAESLGTVLYSGIGGHADFMRGAALAPGGKTILALPATAANGRISRIVPVLKEGSGVTLTRTDVRYVVTEYGIAYIHGKNIRERAMDLIAIAHPKFRPGLINEAKRLKLIYANQIFVPGAAGEYPENLEARRTTRGGLEILLRPVKISDEPLLREFFHSISDESMYRRFISIRTDMPHERLQEFLAVDYTRQMVLLATIAGQGGQEIAGIGQYCIDEDEHVAEVGFVVRDDCQNRGIGYELFSYLTQLAKKRGLLGFTAQILIENRPMLHLFEKMGFHIEKQASAGMYLLKASFASRGSGGCGRRGVGPGGERLGREEGAREIRGDDKCDGER